MTYAEFIRKWATPYSTIALNYQREKYCAFASWTGTSYFLYPKGGGMACSQEHDNAEDALQDLNNLLEEMS